MKVILFQILMIIVISDFIMVPIQIIKAWTKRLLINRIWLVTTRRFQKTICFWELNYRRGRISRGSFLTLSRRRPLSYRKQSIDSQSKSMDWFLYDNSLCHERVKMIFFQILLEILSKFIFALMFSRVKANFPIQCQWSLSRPPEDIRKSLVFWCFQGV